jgi:hypothetical protein
MNIVGEVRCLACGRYLADAADVGSATLRLMPVGGAARPAVRLLGGKPFCLHCGGRAFVEFDLGHRSALAVARERASGVPSVESSTSGPPLAA